MRERVFQYILNGKRPEACGDLLRWARWMETADRHVAQTQIGDVWVSTVFIGLDHNFFGGPPVLFETMAFVNQISAETLAFARYSTWEEAEAGHAAALSIAAAAIAVSQERGGAFMKLMQEEWTKARWKPIEPAVRKSVERNIRKRKKVEQ